MVEQGKEEIKELGVEEVRPVEEQGSAADATPPKKRRRRLLRWLLLSPAILIAAAVFAIYLPPVQHWAVDTVLSQLKSATGMDISVGDFSLKPPLRLELRDVAMVKASGDTMIKAHRVELETSMLPLLKGRISSPMIRVDSAEFNTVDSTGLVHFSSSADLIEIEEAFLNLSEEVINVGYLHLMGGAVLLDNKKMESSPDDDEPSEVRWNIKASNLLAEDVSVKIFIPRVGLYLDTDVEQIQLFEGFADVEHNIYGGEKALLSLLKGSYQRDTLPPLEEGLFDHRHIAVKDVFLEVDKVRNHGIEVDALVRQFRAKERSGLTINSFKVDYHMDQEGILAEGMRLEMPETKLRGSAKMPWAFLEMDDRAIAQLELEGRLNALDLERSIGRRLLPESEVSQQLRDAYLEIDLSAKGTARDLEIKDARIEWPRVMKLELEGRLRGLREKDRGLGKLSLQLDFGEDSSLLTHLFAAPGSYRIPAESRLSGEVEIREGNYLSRLRLTDAESHLEGDVELNLSHERYQLSLASKGLDISHFAPGLGIGPINMKLNARGHSFDPREKGASLSVHLYVPEMMAGDKFLEDLSLDATLQQGEISLSLNSPNSGANMAMQLDGLIDEKSLYTALTLDVVDLEPKYFGLNNLALNGKLLLKGELRTDYKDNHKLSAALSGLDLTYAGERYKEDSLQILASTSREETTFTLSSGGLSAKGQIALAFSRLTPYFKSFSQEISRISHEALHAPRVSQSLTELLEPLPELSLELHTRGYHAIKQFFIKDRINWGALDLKLSNTQKEGLAGEVLLQDFRDGDLRMDRAALEIHTLQRDSLKEKLALELQLESIAYGKLPGYKLMTQVQLDTYEVLLGVMMRDLGERPIHSFRARLGWNSPDYRLAFDTGRSIVISGESYRANAGNYISLGKSDFLLNSDFSLKSTSEASLLLEASGTKKQQEVHLNIARFGLGQLSGLGLVGLGGMLFSDIRYSRAGGLEIQPVITGDLSITDGSYRGKSFGHLATALFYEPRNDRSHYITAEMSYKGAPALSIEGIYSAGQEQPLKATVSLSELPLDMVNPFLKEAEMRLLGKLSGAVNVSGSFGEPKMVGSLSFQEALAELDRYSARLHIGPKPMRIDNSAINFSSFPIFSEADNDTPLVVDGKLDLSRLGDIKADLRLRTQNMRIVDQPLDGNKRQEVYGKVVVTTDMTLRGGFDALNIRGAVSLVGGTNATYVLRSGGLNAQSRLDDMVSFVDSSDTLYIKPKEIQRQLAGMDIALGVDIEPSVLLGVDLSADHKNYVHVQGGGAFSFRMPRFGDMSLTGRYELAEEGELSYTFPIIGAKKFEVARDSYIRFTGDVRNPYIDFSASSKVKSSYVDSDDKSVPVNFLVSIGAKDYLSKLNVKFDLSALDNLEVQNQLAQMSYEERGKQAVSLLTVGQYLASVQGRGDFNLNSTLSSLLQSQINRAAETLLEGTDINIGMDYHDASEMGTAYTDYTYSLSRRFWDDRIRIIIGGTLQTGNLPTNTSQTLIDNAAIEYRLDRSGQQYLKLFHRRVTNDLLEGEYTETGGGYQLRRKARSFLDLFRLFPKQRKDSLGSRSFTVQPWQLVDRSGESPALPDSLGGAKQTIENLRDDEK